MGTSYPRSRSANSPRTAWKFAKLPFCCAKPRFLRLLYNFQTNPFRPGSAGPPPPMGEASLGSPIGAQLSGGERSAPTEPVGETVSRLRRDGGSTSQVALRATYSPRTAWEFAKLPFRLRETALLAAYSHPSLKIPERPLRRDFPCPHESSFANAQLTRPSLAPARLTRPRTKNPG